MAVSQLIFLAFLSVVLADMIIDPVRNDEPLLSPEGLAVLAVVFAGTRLIIALSRGASIGDLRKAVAERLGASPTSVVLVEPHRLSPFAASSELDDDRPIRSLRKPVARGFTRGTDDAVVQDTNAFTPPTWLEAQNARAEPSTTPVTDQATVAGRARDAVLFTPETRRAIYHVLLHPKAPYIANIAPSPSAAVAASRGDIPMETCLWRNAEGTAFAYLGVDVVTAMAPGWSEVPRDQLMQSIEHIGSLTPTGYAITDAVELYLTDVAKQWSDTVAAELPISFTLAFGRELTTRIDINHRIRSMKLTREDVAALASPPFSAFVDQTVLRTFQQVD